MLSRILRGVIMYLRHLLLLGMEYRLQIARHSRRTNNVGKVERASTARIASRHDVSRGNCSVPSLWMGHRLNM